MIPSLHKKLYLAGFAVYAILLVLSVVFYLERTAFTDMAFALCNMAKNGDFAIQIYRFGDGLARIPPFICLKLGLSLKAVAISYSMGFIMVYLACYAICGSVLKQYGLALVVLLINVLFAAHSFYWPMTQVSQAMALSMVLLAMIRGRTLKELGVLRGVLSLMLLITIVFFHPLMMIAYAYIFLFFMLRRGESRSLLLWSALLFAAISWVKMHYFKTDYDSQSMNTTENIFRMFPHYFNTYANRHFLSECVHRYYWIVIAGAIVFAHYVRTREILKGLLFSLFFAGYLFLVNTSYPNEGTISFYMEVLYMPLGLIIALPLIFDVLPSYKPRFAWGLMGLIMVTGCCRIYATHDIYTARLNWERSFMGKYGRQKLIAGTKEVHAEVLQMVWGTPYEFWLLSTIERGSAASIIIDDHPLERAWAKGLTSAFLVNWDIYEYTEIPNKKYFPFFDSTSGYATIPKAP